MESPAESNANAQPLGDATGPEETHQADDTHVEDRTEAALVEDASGKGLGNSPPLDGTEQALVRVDRGKGLENSPLSQLPPELRANIFEMALVHPTGITLRAG